MDSKIVLNYICNDSRRFHVFVSNRVSEVRNLTSPEQWQHIAGSENPADVITRGQQPHELIMGSWIGGPRFLNHYKSDWKEIISLFQIFLLMMLKSSEVRCRLFVTLLKHHSIQLMLWSLTTPVGPNSRYHIMSW